MNYKNLVKTVIFTAKVVTFCTFTNDINAGDDEYMPGKDHAGAFPFVCLNTGECTNKLDGGLLICSIDVVFKNDDYTQVANNLNQEVLNYEARSKSIKYVGLIGDNEMINKIGNSNEFTNNLSVNLVLFRKNTIEGDQADIFQNLKKMLVDRNMLSESLIYCL